MSNENTQETAPDQGQDAQELERGKARKLFQFRASDEHHEAFEAAAREAGFGSPQEWARVTLWQAARKVLTETPQPASAS